MTLDKLIKGVVGAIVIAILLLVVLNWWRDFKSAAGVATPADTETSQSAAPATAPQGEGTQAEEKPATPSDGSTADKTETTADDAAPTKSVEVLIEGLNFREKADRGSKAIRALSKGEKLTLMDTTDSWFQVKDESGVVGWISSSPAYAKVVK